MKSVEMAKQIRLKVLDMCHLHKASHIGGAYSVADILAVLYSDVMNTEEDKFFLSKGHACSALYAALQLNGTIKNDVVSEFTEDGSAFTGCLSHAVLGVELSTGSLGHGLGVACGVAIGFKRNNEFHRNVYVILGDGELNEGSVWESAAFASQHMLNNLIAIVDYNKMQGMGPTIDVLELEPLAEKFRAFGWNVSEVDGHDHNQIRSSLISTQSVPTDSPSVIIAHTTKGKGVSFMENELAWHYRSPNADEYAKAKAELNA
jgi:transketolase